MSSFIRIPLTLLLALSAALNAAAHGGEHNEQIVVAADADWATRHMAEEHHISTFDAATFFTLHDYDSQGLWSSRDIKRTYGLEDESSAHISEIEKDKVVEEILKLFDTDHSGTVTRDEFVTLSSQGIKLPDFGMGPGHHGDDEYEYEIHHWEKYHSGDDVKEEDLNHPEDIAHFKKHEEEEARQEEWERRERAGIVEGNIPTKFRVN
ncbi:hypothetical protein BDV96DRAFT_211460 [Lophiotrema nucula]|uniref:EF-hand domain-containing protein n=1 Tax=Lophiotrema nucula TaxID=690887 RepID=A0A6A5ZP10_9PLEO|nr:hypothetical protein BDV96DRAFT_211460 [Lophiotrema nucula]